MNNITQPNRRCLAANIIPIRLIQGFTLIEVLIAMTLLSVMMALLFGAMKICADSWEKGESKVADVSEVAAVYNFFQRHLTAVVPLSDSLTSDVNFGESFAFQGEAHKLQFLSSFPASAGQTGLQLITLQAEQDGDKGEKIIVSLTPFYPAAAGANWDDEKKATEVDILKRVKHFELRYFGDPDQTGTPDWYPEWSLREFHPRLVKISIALADKDNKNKEGIFWPDIIINLKATQTAVNLGFSFDNIE